MLFAQLGGDCSHAYFAMTLRKYTVDDFDFFRIDNQFAVGARLISVEFSIATLSMTMPCGSLTWWRICCPSAGWKKDG